MKLNKLNISIIIGLIAIFGIIFLQIVWVKQAFSIEEKKFTQKVQISLLEVVKNLYEGTNSQLPLVNPIKKVSNDYYIVSIENDFEAAILEYNLITEFRKNQIFTNFEYAIYNCQSDEMVYGNYVNMENEKSIKKSIQFPKQENLVYYFALRFPNETSYLMGNLQFWIISTVFILVLLLVYVYSIFTIFEQKKYAELQRDFINNMTHEFKTPLSSILIASKYLNSNTNIQEDKLKKYAEIIFKQSTKLNQHVERILKIAKADNSVFYLNKTEFDLKTEIENCCNEILTNNPNIILKIKVPSVFVFADVFHFHNVVFNILDNAIKYSNENTIISISASSQSSTIKVHFADLGNGIPETDKAKIFDKFTRITGTNTKSSNGFGLGLFYVKKVCDNHNWKISVANNQPKGTIFTIEIPKTV